MAYSKLHSSVVGSSLWSEPDSVRILFITLLAMCDKDGCIYGSRPGLERIANIDPDRAEEAWDCLMSPDPNSSDRIRVPELEGRRLEEIPGGFQLLNFQYYRGLRNEDDRREQNRMAQQRFKAKAADKTVIAVSHGKPAKATISHGKPPKAYTETETETETEPPGPLKGEGARRKIPAQPDSDWLISLASDPAYSGIDVPTETAKCQRWCETNQKQFGRRRLVNWLNRVERPLSAAAKDGSHVGPTEPPEGKRSWE